MSKDSRNIQRLVVAVTEVKQAVDAVTSSVWHQQQAQAETLGRLESIVGALESQNQRLEEKIDSLGNDS
jgi:hypothetical protein